MEIPELRIGSVTARIPIVQGGMGVRVSLASLASAVANQGGIGTISSIGLGNLADMADHYEQTSVNALVREIKSARSMTDGLLAVNFMGVLTSVDKHIRAAVDAGIKIIVFGAGMPTRLPELVPEPDMNLVPIISSARVAELILRSWDRRYGRMCDA